MKSEFLEVAIEAATQAGELIKSYWGKSFQIEKKGEIDLVTEVDKKSEKLILSVIEKKFPQHSVLAEESGENLRSKDYLWIIDPIDGTTNFAHGYPCFCVSIALQVKGVVQTGVIFNPLLNEMFTAERGQGAYLNGERMAVSKTDALISSLLCTGFAYNVKAAKANNLNQFRQAVLSAQGVRRDGSAALDIAYVACGRFDGFWEMNLKPWDMAAAVLMVEEAGGKLSLLNGGPFDVFGKDIIVSNGKIHQALFEILNSTPAGPNP